MYSSNLFLDLGTRRGRGVSVTLRPIYTPGKDLAPIVQEAGWAPGPVWTGVENLASTGMLSLERYVNSITTFVPLGAQQELFFKETDNLYTITSKSWCWLW
jgi:hypothetical protein